MVEQQNTALAKHLWRQKCRKILMLRSVISISLDKVFKGTWYILDCPLYSERRPVGDCFWQDHHCHEVLEVLGVTSPAVVLL